MTAKVTFIQYAALPATHTPSEYHMENAQFIAINNFHYTFSGYLLTLCYTFDDRFNNPGFP